MKICGPKLSLCGLIISVWGIIQLVSRKKNDDQKKISISSGSLISKTMAYDGQLILTLGVVVVVFEKGVEYPYYECGSKDFIFNLIGIL